jgi:amino acid transporter
MIPVILSLSSGISPAQQFNGGFGVMAWALSACVVSMAVVAVWQWREARKWRKRADHWFEQSVTAAYRVRPNTSDASCPASFSMLPKFGAMPQGVVSELYEGRATFATIESLTHRAPTMEGE